MNKAIIFIGFLIILILSSSAASDKRMVALGGIQYSVLDEKNELNLFDFAGNMAWLKENDSSDSGNYSLNSVNEWGELHRYWDADGVHQNYFHFSGKNI